MQHIKKKGIPEIEKVNIIMACIDDFSIKKGRTYGTVMIDIDTRRIIDMIDTRDQEPVADWLKTFPALQFVSRDGSATYKSAISAANESITQISDRFHLLKGLTDAAKKHINNYFKANIGLPSSASHYDGAETSDYFRKDIVRADLPTRQHAASTVGKIKLVEEARILQEEGYAPKKIAACIGVTTITAKKYLKPDYSPEYAGYNTTFPSKIKPYADDIKSMLAKGNTFKEIEKSIREKGYDGASSTIRMFATRERKLMKEAGVDGVGNVEKIERKWLVSLLYKPIDKVKELTQEHLDKIIEDHPLIGRLYDVVQSFKETLFSKKEEGLDKWIEEANLLGVDEIDSFIGGVSRDIDAVKNAIKYEYNNGLAEGSVNKLKLTKKIMFGRSSFNTLKTNVNRLRNPISN
jgi:predicted transcriptional regulator